VLSRNAPVRIGIDAHSAERDGSGNCTYIRGLIRGLLEIDGENEYVLYAVDGGHRFYREVRERPRVRLRALNIKSPFLRIPFCLAAATVRDAVDVLHVQYIGPPRHRGSLVATIHDLAFLHLPRTFSRLEARRSRLLVPRTAKAAGKIITGSECSKRDIVAECGVEPGKIEVIPCGVSGSFAEARHREDGRGIPAKYGIRTPYVLSVGRLNARKNLAVLAEAYSLAKKRQSLPHTLVIVGKKDHGSASLVESVRKTGGGEILFTGFVPDEDLPGLYAGADVLVYPSLFEGFGLPLIEAMASGVPVVASDAPALRETMGDAGWAVDPLQPEEMAAAISGLVRDERLRKDFIARGTARAAEFTWRRTARMTLAVYAQAAARRPD
jgi:glycosyltransferase involved in cell wall biosynthesis